MHTKSSQSRVDTVGPVGGSHDNHMSSLLQAIHQSQQLRHDAPLNLTMSLYQQIT
jgi:hypothetical protein